MNYYAKWLIKHRSIVILGIVLITIIFGFFAAGMKVIIDPAALAPQGHRYIESTNNIDKVFGSKYFVVIGVTPKAGDIYQPIVLESVSRITRKLELLPGVVQSTLMSVASNNSKGIIGGIDGFDVHPMLKRTTSLTSREINNLRSVLKANPIYVNTIISQDSSTAAIFVELKENPEGFQRMLAPLKSIVDAENNPNIKISLGGSPVFLDKTEEYSARIALLFPIAVLLIGLLHYEAFRTWQGMVLPLVTALVSVVWGLGIMGILGRSLDVFNSPTPILILAIAAGHAVQLLKRYYEEYASLQALNTLSDKEANTVAVMRSLEKVGPVMIIAGAVAACCFLSLLTFNIPTIRAFGLFTAVGILSAVVIEMTLIPAVRSLLAPPASSKNANNCVSTRIWDVIPSKIGNLVIQKQSRKLLLLLLVFAVIICIAGSLRVVVDNSTRDFFSDSLQIRQDDNYLNSKLGGSNGLYIMIEAAADDEIKDPELLRKIEGTQKYAETLEHVGKTVSIVDYLKRLNKGMHSDIEAYNVLPESRELIAQYLLLYSMSGSLEDFDSVVDYKYRKAKITILLKTSSNIEVRNLVARLEEYTKAQFGDNAKVYFGGDVVQTIAVTETMVRGKLLNIVQISLAVFFATAIVFQSVLAGLIVLAPLGMAVLSIFGVMGWFGIPLNIPNALISAMAVGIGADYAIYFIYRLREFTRVEEDIQTAIRKTLSTAGTASLYVATAVAGGYGVLALSPGYKVHQWTALLIVVAMIVSVVASLILTPLFTLHFKPAFIFKTEQSSLLKRIIIQAALLVLLTFLLSKYGMGLQWAIAKILDVGVEFGHH